MEIIFFAKTVNLHPFFRTYIFIISQLFSYFNIFYLILKIFFTAFQNFFENVFVKYVEFYQPSLQTGEKYDIISVIFNISQTKHERSIIDGR